MLLARGNVFHSLAVTCVVLLLSDLFPLLSFLLCLILSSFRSLFLYYTFHANFFTPAGTIKFVVFQKLFETIKRHGKQ
jgi:hypothetical protein